MAAFDAVVVGASTTITNHGLVRGTTRADEIQNTGITVGDNDEVSGANILRATETVIGSTTLEGRHSVVRVDATTTSITITLETSPLTGQIHDIKKVDPSVNAVTLSGNNIDGSSTATIATHNENLTVSYSGAVWDIL